MNRRSARISVPSAQARAAATAARERADSSTTTSQQPHQNRGAGTSTSCNHLVLEGHAAAEAEAGRRCGQCGPCLRPDCGTCTECRRKRRFGGDGSSKRSCLQRFCAVVYPQVSNNNNHTTSATGGAATSSSTTASTSNSHNNNAVGLDPTSSDSIMAKLLSSVDPEARANYEILQRTDPTGYLLHPDNEEADRVSFKKRKAETSSQPDRCSTKEDEDEEECCLYGQPIPTLNLVDRCAGCLGPTVDVPQCVDDVLLCDGDGCNREYHIGCCIPRILDIPQDEWLCRDCHPEGSTQYLREYFDAMERRREDKSRVKNLYELILRDAEVAKVPPDGIPMSELELERASMYDSVALDEVRLSSTDDEYPKLGPDFFIGKPVRLYDDMHDYLHVGRIVDWRKQVESEEGISHNEYLIRFLPGSDDRKMATHHWVSLEEHNLLVGTTLIYLHQKRDDKAINPWLPAMVWLRSTRALLSLYTINRNFKSFITTSPHHAKKKPRASTPGSGGGSSHGDKIWAVARAFGRDKMDECNLRTQAVDFHSPAATAKHVKTSKDRLLVWMATAESHAQERVRMWHALPQQSPYHPLAFTARDEYRLGPLVPINKDLPYTQRRDATKNAGLCPMVSHGVDRMRILDLLHKQGGVIPTKDVASTLSFRIVSISNAGVTQQNDY